MKEKMMRIIVAVMLTLLLCSLTLLAGAASKNDWKNTAGCYVWTESSQYNNGVLNIKPLGDDKYLYELKVMRGSEEEDSAEDFVTAGVFEINEDGDWIDENTGKVLKHFDPSFAHTIGTAYGFIVKKYDLMNKLLNSLKNDKEDRRRVISLWQDSELDTAVLPSCVWSSEWDVTDGKLNIWVHQRSCDVPLGLPFNVTQYAVLLMMVAKVTGLEPGTIDWSIKDAHIYVNQIDGIKEQLNRYETKGSLPAPKLWLNPDIQDFYAFDPKNDVKLIGYEHMGKISFPLAQ